MHIPIQLTMPSPSGPELKAARQAAGLSQVQAAELMGYPVQPGSRGGVRRTHAAVQAAMASAPSTMLLSGAAWYCAQR